MVYMVLISLVTSALCLITGIGLTIIGASLIEHMLNHTRIFKPVTYIFSSEL
jgi:hypothetical protein